MRSEAAGEEEALPTGGPSSISDCAYLPYVEKYWICAVLIVCSARIAAISYAAMRALVSLGIAIAAMIRMIAITMSNSINENPRRRRIRMQCLLRSPIVVRRLKEPISAKQFRVLPGGLLEVDAPA